MDNFNNNANAGGGAALLLMCLSSSLSSSSGSSLFAGAIQSNIEARNFINSTNAAADKAAEEIGLDANQIRADMRKMYQSVCIKSPKDGRCPPEMRVGSNGCCEYTDPKKRSKSEVMFDVAKNIIEEIIISFLFEAIVKEIIRRKLISSAIRGVASVAARIAALTGAKAAAGMALKLESRFAAKATTGASCGPVCMAAMVAFEVISAALDITDPMGYNTFQPNEAAINTRNVIDVGTQKSAKEGDEPGDYPMTFPLSVAFPQHDAGFAAALMEKFLPDALQLLDEATMSQFIGSMLDGSEISNELSAKITDAFDLVISKKHKERDLAIYQYYRRKGLGLHIESVPFMSTPRRIGVTLSKYGADVYNRRMKPLHLKYSNPFNRLPSSKIPEDYTPLVAMYTDTYRVMNTSNPGSSEKPNVVPRKLSRTITLAMPYGMLVSQCSVGMQGAHSQRINPETYGVKFNNSTGYCDFTKEYCRRFGLEFKNNDCKLAPGQKFAEMIFGTTLTRETKQDFQGRIDAWKSGDPGQIALATALTALDVGTGGLSLGVRLAVTAAYNELKGSYGRGAGKSMVCRQGYEQKGALCYPQCREGYRSSALECEGVCPPGSRNTGLTCIQGIHAYIPSNQCGQFWRSCFYKRKPCRDGYRYRGSTCNRECLPGFTFRSGAAGSAFCDKPRNRYSRAGKAKPLDSCPSGMEKDGALCYKQCREGFRGDGPLCKVADPGKRESIYDIAK